jgi:hypothetical protein
MQSITINNKGEREVDPYDHKGNHEKWLKSINYPENPDFLAFKGISQDASRLLTQYLLDLYVGKNLARGTKRGQRSFIHLCNSRMRLRRLVADIETRTKKKILDLTEDDILFIFNGMRNGTILNFNEKPYMDVCSYSKRFIAFWHWIQKTQKETHPNLLNIVESLDSRKESKPKWIYFTLKDVEAMGDIAPDFYYKVLVFFLFDSGIRAPKELMNVRAKDFSEVPGTNLLFLTVREETSKTFGRKIKLMIASDLIKKFIEKYKLHPDDFLFTKTYIHTTRIIAKIGHKILGIGKVHKQKHSKILIRQGVTMYDFRHNSCCHYLPIYKSENQMMYRYGWKKGEMIHYYSEFIGMKDTITEDDMLIDTTKTEIMQQLQKEQNKVVVLQEQMQSQREEMDERMKKMEQMLLQKFASNF